MSDSFIAIAGSSWLVGVISALIGMMIWGRGDDKTKSDNDSSDVIHRPGGDRLGRCNSLHYRQEGDKG